MTYEQAINYLFSSGFSDEQVKGVVRALNYEPCEDWKDGCLLNERISKLPPVIPQPKTGRWILSDDGLCRPICDKCGVHPWKGYIPTVEEATEVFKYCPNCGAKMERSDKE